MQLISTEMQINMNQARISNAQIQSEFYKSNKLLPSSVDFCIKEVVDGTHWRVFSRKLHWWV